MDLAVVKIIRLGIVSSQKSILFLVHVSARAKIHFEVGLQITN